MGRYVPQLNFLEVLLGDEPVLPVESHFYQRLLALDEDEARDIAERSLKDRSIGSFYDSVLIPALTLAEQDRHLNLLEAGTTNFVNENTRDLIEELGERSLDNNDKAFMFASPASNNNNNDNDDNAAGANQSPAYSVALSGLRVVCIPAADEADKLVGMMLAQLLEQLGCDVRQMPVAPRAELLNELAANAAQVAIVSALPPFAVGQARSLCKGLRQRQPGLKILIGLWNFEGGVPKAQDRVGPGVADMIATTLQQAVSLLVEATHDPNDEAGQPGSIHQEVVTTDS